MSQSLGRGLGLLQRIADGVDTLDALASATGVHKTTILRQLATMLELGFVTRDAAHRYRLGPAVHELARASRELSDVTRVAPPVLRELMRTTGQTVHLAGWDGAVVTYLDKVEPPTGLHMVSRIGQPAPMHATAVGKVLLAGMPPAERRAVVEASVLERYTARTIVDPAQLLAETDEVAARGWALDHEEHEPFMICIGAPVRAAGGDVVAAVSVSVPNVVLPLDGVLALLPDLRDAAGRISARLAAPPHENRKASP